jgi:hypothetical protein
MGGWFRRWEGDSGDGKIVLEMGGWYRIWKGSSRDRKMGWEEKEVE